MRRLAIAFLLPAFVLGGCETVALAVATPIVWQKKHVNLLNSSYAAADSLAYNTSRKLKKQTPLIMKELYEIVHQPDTTGQFPPQKIYPNPRLGRAITDQINSRFIQLGYNVMPGYPGGTAPAAEFQGTYEIVSGGPFGDDHLNVALTITDKKSGRVLGVHNYSLPVTTELRDYMAEGNYVLPSFMRD